MSDQFAESGRQTPRAYFVPALERTEYTNGEERHLNLTIVARDMDEAAQHANQLEGVTWVDYHGIELCPDVEVDPSSVPEVHHAWD